MTLHNTIVAAHVVPYTLAFPRPIETARVTLSARTGWILVLEDEDGVRGYGDAAPWPGFGSGETRTEADLTRVVEETGQTTLEVLGPEAAHALSLARLDLEARSLGRPLSAVLAEIGGRGVREKVPVAVLVDGPEAARRAVVGGARTLKVKIGRGSVADDDRFLAEVRKAAGEKIGIRADANGAWSRDEAIDAVRLLARHGLQYIEQPVAADDLEGLHAVRARTGVRVAADESLRTPEDVEAVLEMDAADVLVLKPMFVGGPEAAIRLAQRVLERNRRAVITHSLESAVGRMAALHAAATLPESAPASGLSSPFYGTDIGPTPAIVDGHMEVPTDAGLGFEPALALDESEDGG